VTSTYASKHPRKKIAPIRLTLIATTIPKGPDWADIPEDSSAMQLRNGPSRYSDAACRRALKTGQGWALENRPF